MNFRRGICWTVICALAVFGTAAAQKGGGGSKTSFQEPVTSVVFDNDDTGAPLLMRSDNYNGAGQATYTNIKAKGAGYLVSSEILANGRWQLALKDESGRTLWVTPDEGIDSSQPPAPPAGYYAVQKAFSTCRDQGGNIVPFQNVVNGSGNCSMTVNFFYGGVLYMLTMRPGSLEGALCPSGGCPATGLAKVSCNEVANSQCVNWTITPNANAPLVRVSNLYSYTGPRDTPWVYIGQYYNSFSINVTYP
jgi:hypothetical protein